MLTVLIVAALSSLQPAAGMTADQRLLAEELEADVRSYRTSLPTTDGLLTIAEVRLRRLEIVYTGIVASDLNAESIAIFRRAVRDGLCTGDTGDVIRRGGAFTYELRDREGEYFETTISTCD